MKKLNRIFPTVMVSELDSYTIENENVNSVDLMERAAAIWTDFFLKFSGFGQEIAVVTGCGNNGGDGFVIARLLKAAGRKVMVFHLSGIGRLSGDCEVNLERWRGCGGEVWEVKEEADFMVAPEVVLVDAVFGAGLNRKVVGVAGEVIRKMNLLPNKVVAVDVPSGLLGEDNSENDTDTIVRADYTFTFQFPKLSFLLPETARFVGKWEVLDIGLSREWMEKNDTLWRYTTVETVQELLPVLDKYAHKGTNGRGMLIAGSYGMMGAALLGAKAAVRSGIGLLYCHVPQRGVEVMQMEVPEAIVSRDESEVCFSGELEVAHLDAVAVGPGLGKQPETVEGIRRLLEMWRGITILDADALNVLSEHSELLGLLHSGCLLTPHMKEFERLVGKCKNDFDRLNKLSTFASRYQCHIVLKGAHSVVATPAGYLYFNMSGNPGMAKGGMGDVLTGVLLALASNGLKVLDVARIGVFAHGLSADLLMGVYGCRGISAGMVAEGMGNAWWVLEDKKLSK